MSILSQFSRGFAASLSLGLCLILAGESAGQTVATVPVGAITVTIAAATQGSIKFTTFSPVLRLPLSASFVGKTRGTFTSVSDIVLSDDSAAWSPSALSQASTPYFIHIKSGLAVGAWWQVSTSSSNTSTQATVLTVGGVTPSIAGLAVGDSYEIVPADTLDSFFAGIESLIGGTSSSNADSVRIYDGSIWRNFYYNTALSQWREGTAIFNRNAIVIRPNSGVIFGRRGTTPLTFTISGNVSDSTEKFAVPSNGISFVGGVFPVDRNLSTLGVNSINGFVAYNGDLNACDKVRVFDATTSTYRIFNYSAVNAQWREGASTFNRNAYVVPAGTPFIIERGYGASGGSAILSQPIPYTL